MFKRLLIRLRWPMAIMALTAGAALFASCWRHIRCGFPCGSPGALVLSMDSWNIVVAHVDAAITEYESSHDASGHNGWMFELLPPNDLGDQHWTWWFEVHDLRAFGFWTIQVPPWAIVIPPAALAALGFIARRKRPRSDQCTRCRHTLAGALICPECGCSAPSN